MFRSKLTSLAGAKRKSHCLVQPVKQHYSKKLHALRDVRSHKRRGGFGRQRTANDDIINREASRETFSGMEPSKDPISPDGANQYIGERWSEPGLGRSGPLPLQEGASASQGQPLNDEGTLFCYNFNAGRMVSMKSRYGQATLKSVTQAIDIYSNNIIGGRFTGPDTVSDYSNYMSDYVPELHPSEFPHFYKERRFHPHTLDQIQEYKRTPKYYNSVGYKEPDSDTPAVMLFNSVTPGEGLTATSKVGSNQWMLRRKLYELTYLFYEQMEKKNLYETHRADQSTTSGDRPLNNNDTCPVNVSVLNGPLVGSGACLSLFHKYVIGTAGTSYTCPDIYAGRIPNNGNLYVLSRLNKLYPGFGTWLGLSGARLKVEDMIALGMVTHYSEVPGLGEQVMRRLDEHVQLPTEEQLKNVLANVTEHPDSWKTSEPRFLDKLPKIEEAFGELDDIPSFMANSKKIPYINEVFEHVKHKGDLVAAACFLQAMKFAEDMEPHQILNMEYRIMAHLSSRQDQPEEKRSNDIGSIGDYFDKHPEVPDIFLPEQMHMFKSNDNLNPASESILDRLELKK